MFRRCQGRELFSLSGQWRRCGDNPILVGGRGGGCIVSKVGVGWFVGRKIRVEWWTAVVAPPAGIGADTGCIEPPVQVVVIVVDVDIAVVAAAAAADVDVTAQRHVE